MVPPDTHQVTLDAAAEAAGGRVEGDGSLLVSGIAALRHARAGELSFVAEERYAKQAAATEASAVIAPDGLDLPEGCPPNRVRVPDVQAALLRLAHLFALPEPPPASGVHPAAVVGSAVELAPDASVGPCAVIEDGAVIAAGAVIGPHVFIGRGARIGAQTRLGAGVKIASRCRVGARCVLHPGVVIGGDGFGFYFADGVHNKIPQIGTVVIEDDVEIGSNTTVDRARFGETRIGRGTKIDNLVMIAHNVHVGCHCILTGQVGVAGSTTIGNYVMVGAQAGIIGHIEIGDGTKIGGQSGVNNDLPPGSTVLGVPARPHRDAARAMIAATRLPETVRSIRDLRRELDELRRRVDEGSGS